MGMLGKCLGLVMGILFSATLSANDVELLWQDQPQLSARNGVTNTSYSGRLNARQLTLNTDAMKSLLLNSATQQQGVAQRSYNQITVELPLPNGKNVSVGLEPTHVMPDSLANKYPTIRTYRIASTASEILSGRLDYTNQGFHAMLHTRDGETVFIDPENSFGTTEYLSYRKTEQPHDDPFQCNTPEAHDHSQHSKLRRRVNSITRNSGGIVEYRIAIAATAEYTRNQGGSVDSALSAIVTTLNRVNSVYEQSLGVRLTLVENNDQIIYTNSTTDPYSNFNIETLLSENQNNIDQVIGNNNYDLGHVFGTSGGGLAYIGSLCNNDKKAMAASGIRSPYGDSFDIDFVAHELGHQLGATHTFNSIQGICTTGARTAYSAFEPGSGSSIMSYAGGCGTDDLQSNADAMFHSGNIQQIQLNILAGKGSSCGVQHISTNQKPIVSAGTDYTIPANTPFQLTATAIDADEDTLLYSWEQYDTGSATSLTADSGDNPLFRIYKPSPNKTRLFPSMKTLTGEEIMQGETLPQTDRYMKFQVAAYDQHNSPAIDQMLISVINTGNAFKLDKPYSAYQRGNFATINWNTADTELAPISCHSVSLYLSTNNGNDFEHLLAQDILNSGSASVFIPGHIPDTSAGRFKLICSNNIFFSISSQTFAIGQEATIAEESTRSSETDENDQKSTLSGGGSISYLFLMLIIFVISLRNHTST